MRWWSRCIPASRPAIIAEYCQLCVAIRMDSPGTPARRNVPSRKGAATDYHRVVTHTPADRMRGLVASLQELEDQLKAGGGAKKIEKQHSDGKLTARERVALLIDPGALFLEIGLLVAYDRYDGQAPAAGVVTGLSH